MITPEKIKILAESVERKAYKAGLRAGLEFAIGGAVCTCGPEYTDRLLRSPHCDFHQCIGSFDSVDACVENEYQEWLKQDSLNKTQEADYANDI